MISLVVKATLSLEELLVTYLQNAVEPEVVQSTEDSQIKHHKSETEFRFVPKSRISLVPRPGLVRPKFIGACVACVGEVVNSGYQPGNQDNEVRASEENGIKSNISYSLSEVEANIRYTRN